MSALISLIVIPSADLELVTVASTFPKALNSTLPSDRFIPLHMILVRNIPDAPTRQPLTINAWFCKTKPVAAAAIPEYELSSDITTGISAPPIGITDKIPSNKPIKPDKTLNFIIGIILGLGAGVCLVVIIEYFDNTIKSVEQIERRGLSILAIIPSIGIDSKKKKTRKYIKDNKNIEKLQRRLITHEDPKSPISEAYRSLRTSLMYTKKNSECNLVLVSSAGPGEGKTTTITNLAITYANLNKKTLLVDSDLRKPVLHQMFKNLPKDKGLTNFLTNSEKNINNIIISTSVENLSIVTSGITPPNPSEMLSSSLMKEFINAIKKDFDIILFDTPPLVAVTDASVITKFADKFLLVIRASVTEKGALERALVNISNIGCKIDGVVFNGVDESNTYGGGYYYNYYQYYYGHEEDKK